MLELRSKVYNGQLSQGVRKRIQDALKRMDGKYVEIVLRKPKKHSSDPQRRYYFAAIVPACQNIFREAGTVMSKDDMHHWLMENVGKWQKEVVGPGGEISTMRRSYMDLSTQEAQEHHTLCRHFAAENGVDVLEPNEEAV